MGKGPPLDRLAVLVTVAATLGISLLSWLGTNATLATSRRVLAQLPDIPPGPLVERLLAGAVAGAFGLLLLGSLTTAVSTLFLSEELAALTALPLPRGALFARQLAVTAAAAAAPTLLVGLPAILAASRYAPRPLLGFGALVLLFAAIALLATVLGAALALALVRFVPPRRARFAAAFLAALGLSAALVGFRAARPERLLDPIEALRLLESIAHAPLPPPRGPLSFAAHAAASALAGDGAGLATALFAFVGAALLALLAALLLAPAHRRAWESAREAPALASTRGRGRDASGLSAELRRAETRTLLRDASTPAQLGTLTAVAALYLLNLRLLPTGDATSRDLLMGLQTALALFLVGALALRFGFPAVSSDGRAALILRSLPLRPERHLVLRWAVRAVPALALALLLVGASAAALRPDGRTLLRALLLAVAGGAAIPAIHVGLGALRPRYDAENPIAVALGPGGLFAIGVATVLSALAAPVVSRELALLCATVLKRPLPPNPLLAAWVGAALLAGAVSVAAAARTLSRRDLSGS